MTLREFVSKNVVAIFIEGDDREQTLSVDIFKGGLITGDVIDGDEDYDEEELVTCGHVETAQCTKCGVNISYDIKSVTAHYKQAHAKGEV